MIPFLDDTIKTLDRKDLEAAAFGTGCVFVRPKHRRPSELADLVAESVASGVEVFVPDDSRNILYLEDTPSYFGGNIEALQLFDVPPTQIEVRVRIYEIDDARGRDVGLDWYAWKKAIDDGHLTFQWDNTPNPGSYDIDLQSLSGELSFNPLLATEFLNYLVDRGRAKIITDSRIALINGRPGAVRAVRQIPYVVRGFIDNDVADSPLRDSPEALDADRLIKEFTEGVTVEMVPTIGTETIELEVLASVASHVGYTPNQSVPILATSDVETGVILADGKPAVIGGLTRTTVVNERSGIPGLISIPGLRYLFSRDVQREHKGHILITVVPVRVDAGTAIKADDEAVPPAM
jgi:type II secretory pathway component GspD/PulD (secretin)